jgi:hypothetical protein
MARGPHQVIIACTLGVMAAGGCADPSGPMTYDHRRPTRPATLDACGALVLAAFAGAVALVSAGGHLAVGTYDSIRDRMRDGPGGVDWDSAEGRRLRNPPMSPVPRAPAEPAVATVPDRSFP